MKSTTTYVYEVVSLSVQNVNFHSLLIIHVRKEKQL